jgi:hypothetical protein
MARYQVITLVDITRTHASRYETDKIKLGQQANFNALQQAIGLRSNFSFLSDPNQQSGQLPRDLEGRATYWTWNFDTERDSVFLKEDNPVGLLIDDINGVPITNQLNNSVDIDPAAFISRGDRANIWVYEITQAG